MKITLLGRLSSALTERMPESDRKKVKTAVVSSLCWKVYHPFDQICSFGRGERWRFLQARFLWRRGRGLFEQA